jgi:flagellar motor switch protein FliM
MSIQPYRFKLRKISSERLRLLDAMHSYLPSTGLEDTFLAGLKDAVEVMLGDGFSLLLETVEQGAFSGFLAKLPAHPLIAVIGLAPGNQKLMLEIDATLAMMAVERMLGGHVETMPEARALTETEQGVLQYLLLKLLLMTHRACGADARVHFRFDKFISHPDELARMVEEDSTMAVAGFRATLGRHAGFVRLMFTNPFLEQMLLSASAPGESRPAELRHALDAMKRYAYVRVPLWAEVGRTALKIEDVRQLEEGDVVLLEQGDIDLSSGGAGKAIMRLGDGLVGGVDVDMRLSPTRAHCTVQGIHKGV